MIITKLLPLIFIPISAVIGNWYWIYGSMLNTINAVDYFILGFVLHSVRVFIIDTEQTWGASTSLVVISVLYIVLVIVRYLILSFCNYRCRKPLGIQNPLTNLHKTNRIILRIRYKTRSGNQPHIDQTCMTYDISRSQWTYSPHNEWITENAKDNWNNRYRNIINRSQHKYYGNTIFICDSFMY